MVELNGVDESLDTGDDCHEVNLRDRAKMLQYQTCVCVCVCVCLSVCGCMSVFVSLTLSLTHSHTHTHTKLSHAIALRCSNTTRTILMYNADNIYNIYIPLIYIIHIHTQTHTHRHT